MAALGRWGAVDPLADRYAGYSPYNYVLGNPNSLIDPDGMQVADLTAGSMEEYGSSWNALTRCPPCGDEGVDEADLPDGSVVFSGYQYSGYLGVGGAVGGGFWANVETGDWGFYLSGEAGFGLEMPGPSIGGGIADSEDAISGTGAGMQSGGLGVAVARRNGSASAWFGVGGGRMTPRFFRDNLPGAMMETSASGDATVTLSVPRAVSRAKRSLAHLFRNEIHAWNRGMRGFINQFGAPGPR
jgi:hypothetical protein